MQDDLRASLEQSAAENGRSLNAEIVARLQESLAQINNNAEQKETQRILIHLDMIGDQDLKVKTVRHVFEKLHELYGADVHTMIHTVELDGQKLIHVDDNIEMIPVVVEIAPRFIENKGKK